jgi:hypothetical protein
LFEGTSDRGHLIRGPQLKWCNSFKVGNVPWLRYMINYQDYETAINLGTAQELVGCGATIEGAIFRVCLQDGTFRGAARPRTSNKHPTEQSCGTSGTASPNKGLFPLICMCLLHPPRSHHAHAADEKNRPSLRCGGKLSILWTITGMQANDSKKCDIVSTACYAPMLHNCVYCLNMQEM